MSDRKGPERTFDMKLRNRKQYHLKKLHIAKKLAVLLSVCMALNSVNMTALAEEAGGSAKTQNPAVLSAEAASPSKAKKAGAAEPTDCPTFTSGKAMPKLTGHGLQEYTIKYELGCKNPGNPETYTEETETFTLINPEMEGYTFTGWTGSCGATPQQTVTIEKGSTGNRTYKAEWTRNRHNLIVIAGEGISAVSGGGVKEFLQKVTAVATVSEGYRFSYWVDKYGKVQSASLAFQFDMRDEEIELTATATKKEYKVTFQKNGRGSDTPDQTVKYGEKPARPSDPTDPDYCFAGWYREAECTTAWDFDTDTVTAATTLFAKWLKKTAVSDFLFAPPAALVYDKTAKEATVSVKSGISGMGQVTVRYTKDGAPVSAAVNAGAYQVIADVAEGTVYAAGTNITDAAWTFTIARAVPKEGTDYAVPTGLTAKLGQTLREITLPTGFTWNTPAADVGGVGENIFAVTFTPSDTDNYEIKNNINVKLTVSKQDPPDAPQGLAGVRPTEKGKSNGKITGTDSTMEYQRKGTEDSWTAVTGSEITALTAGTYLVRYAATASRQASTAAAVAVPEGDENSGSDEPLITGTWGNPVTDGTWYFGTDGKWMYRTSKYFKNTWGYIYNPYAKEDRKKTGWFYFDANGKMLTGWQRIKGKWYYLHEVSDGTLGRCYIDTTTPDGHRVDQDGVMIQ